MGQQDFRLAGVESLDSARRFPWVIVLIVLIVLSVWLIPYACREKEQEEDVTDRDQAEVASAAGQRSDDGVGNAVASRDSGDDVSGPADQAGIHARVAAGHAAQQADDLQLARRKWLEALALSPPQSLRREIEKALGTATIKLLCTPRRMSEKIDYTIRSGDYLSALARKFGTTKSLLQKSNQITDPNRIRRGDRLRILNEVPFSIHVRKQANDLVLRMNGAFVKRYPVGTGEFGRTPTGTYRIADRIVNPVWWRSDGKAIPYGQEGNVLGTRWMKLEATGETPDSVGYGIHGTWEDESIGKQSSAGCIRMYNADVEEVFMIVPIGTAVEITE